MTHEAPRSEPWAVTETPETFIRSQLRGIVGLRLPIARIKRKRKMSQNRSAEDRAGVAAGLAASDRPAIERQRAWSPGTDTLLRSTQLFGPAYRITGRKSERTADVGERSVQRRFTLIACRSFE